MTYFCQARLQTCITHYYARDPRTIVIPKLSFRATREIYEISRRFAPGTALPPPSLESSTVCSRHRSTSSILGVVDGLLPAPSTSSLPGVVDGLLPAPLYLLRPWSRPCGRNDSGEAAPRHRSTSSLPATAPAAFPTQLLPPHILVGRLRCSNFPHPSIACSRRNLPPPSLESCRSLESCGSLESSTAAHGHSGMPLY